MRIRRLELYGFKSFCDRTAFTFGDGISCVVGPNGSGKSNVVDALKWVIGEQSARSLRGADMQDVIFAGSANRKPVGFAEVQLTLAADDGEPFPGEYAGLREVQVGRRLHRSGASEYLINQVKCRRRDVVDLFLDTGVGTNLYSFIEQGRVDKVVSATPPERRELIDEAAGISRYKQRRAEARTRLEATVTQLDRAADVADEMARRLAVLEKQVVKAARFRRLRARVRQRETFLSLVKYRGLSADRRALQQQMRDARGEEAAARRGVARREEDLRARREEVASVDAAATTWRDELAEHDARLRELASQRQLHGQRAEELAAQATQAQAQQEQVALEQEGVGRQLANLREALAATEAALASRAGSDDEARAHVERLEAAAETARVARATARTHEASSRDALAKVEARQQALALRLEELPEQLEAATLRVATLGDEQAEAAKALEAATSEAEATTATVAAARAEQVDAEKALAAVEAEIARRRAAAEARLAQAMAEVNRKRSDLATLERSQRAAEAERQRQHQRRQKEARQQRDRTVQQQVGRGRAWVDAVRSVGTRRLRGAESDLARARAEADAALRAAEREARQEGERRLQAVLAQTEERIRGVLGPLRSAASGARSRRDGLRDDVAQVRVRQAKAEARVASLEARLADSEASSDLGPALVDRLEPEAAQAALDTLGRRASLPAMAAPEAVLEARDRLPEGTTVEVYAEWHRPTPPAVVATLAEALAHHQATGEGARVAGSSERIEADGTVVLARGDVAGPAERRLRWRRELDEAVQAREEALQEEARLITAQEAAEQALTEAEAALATAEREAEGARRQARRAADQQAAAAVQAVLDEGAARREAVEAEGQVRVEAARGAADAAVREALAAREAAEAVLRDQADQALALAERAAEAEQAAAREAEGQVHGEATAAVDAALAAAEAVRATPPEALPDLDGPRSRLAAARDRAGAAAARAAEAAQRRALAQAKVDTLARDARGAHAEEAGLTARLEQARADAEAVAVELGEARAAQVAAVARRERAEVDAEDASRVASEAAQALASARAEGSALSERKSGQQARLQELQARHDALVRQGSDAAQRAEGARVRGGEAAAASEAAAAEAAELETVRAASYDRLERERGRSSELKASMAEAETDLAALQERFRKATQHMQDLVEQSTAVRAEIEALRQRIDERYQVSLPGLLDRLDRNGRLDLQVDPAVAEGLKVGQRVVEGVDALVVRPAHLDDAEAVKVALGELEEDRAALQRLGEVHLGAMEEYEELATRHSELATQREDLEGSVQRLRAAIAKMNKTCRERFREAFDQVNENFQVSYPQLLGGGTARLALTDDEDLLETGVEIFVQPPGKRLQSLSLLSGGEKAMTAIALLIALFRVRPSPFCVLDEVDAPLDERNGGRFNGMLRDLATTSQFVVITHNRKTMECADTLYGVSMTTPGVSSLVSVAL